MWSFFTRDRLNWCDFNSWFQQKLIKCYKIWWNTFIWWFIVRKFIWLSINSFFDASNEIWWKVHPMIFSKKIHLIIINAFFMRFLSEWRLMLKCSFDDSLYYKRIHLINQFFVRFFQWLFRWRKQLNSHLIMKQLSILSFNFSDD